MRLAGFRPREQSGQLGPRLDAELSIDAREVDLHGSYAHEQSIGGRTVARATVYRHFPSRQALLDRLAERAVQDASDRLVAARLDEVPPRDAVKRAIRALVEAGDYVTVLAGARAGSDTDGLAEAMATPLVRMIQRGQSDGSLRPDLPADWIADSLVGIVLAILSSPRKQGRENTVDSVVALFLDGAGFHQATPTPPEAQ